jgi:hypothetical protein
MLEQVAGAVSATTLRLSLPPVVEIARVVSLRK